MDAVTCSLLSLAKSSPFMQFLTESDYRRDADLKNAEAAAA
jgi:hypothetical protein